MRARLFNASAVLLGLLWAACGQSNATAAADAELRDYQLHALEARVQNMPEGTERDYFSGMLASRSGQFDDAIARLNRALPGLRQSEPKRAAKHTGESAGVGGSIRHDIYVQPHVVMKAGPATVTLKDVPIFPDRMNAAIDLLFGNLGQDFVDGFESFSLDFRAMVFGLGAPVSREPL